ncbi:MAG: acetylornithine transaminase [bacterium]
MGTENSNSSIVERASKVIMSTYGRFPIALVKGEGCWAWDADGKKYLDLVAGIAVNCLGHAHPRMVKAIAEQASQIIHTSNLYQILPQIELAETLTKLSFADKAFFCNSGAEANEGAVKLARKYQKKKNKPERYRVVCMQNAFHGRTLAMINATGQEKYRKGFEPPVDGFLHVPFGNFEALEKVADDTVAAVLLEPIQGEGGIVLAPDEYLKKVRKFCDERGLLLIYDEVQTGVGRTGKMFGYEHSGVAPDVMTLAKCLAGVVPIGAILAKGEAANVFEPGDHAATFGGNHLATHVAREVIQVLQDGVLKNCQEVGAYFLDRLKELQKKHPVISDVRGKGLMIGAQLDRPGKEYVTKAMEKGLLINCTQESVLRFVPPLILSKAEVDHAIKILDEIL